MRLNEPVGCLFFGSLLAPEFHGGLELRGVVRIKLNLDTSS